MSDAVVVVAGGTALSSLPDEILASIALYLDLASLIALKRTCRRFNSVTEEPQIWRTLCRHTFRYWNNPRHFKLSLLDPARHDWKDIVNSRIHNTRMVRRRVAVLINDPICRPDRVQNVLEAGYMCKDALLRSFHANPQSTNYLAQRYWSHVALGSLQRSTAIQMWEEIKRNGKANENYDARNDDNDGMERALAGLDMFILDQREIGDIEDILDTLRSYAQAVRDAYPDIDRQTPRQKATTIAAYLLERNWIGLDNESRYYSLDNMFLGVALYSSRHNSSPLISSVIYCYVCRQFGLRARPCNFPVHVHSVVEPPKGIDLDGNPISSTNSASDATVPTNRDTNRLYMDPFHTAEPLPISTLRQQLRFIGNGLPETELQSALEPATINDMVSRAANNIINSITRHTTPQTYDIDTESALYAARFALALFPISPAHLRNNLQEVTQTFLHNFDIDVDIFRSHILPRTYGSPDEMTYMGLSAQLTQSDLDRPVPKCRRKQRLSTPQQQQQQEEETSTAQNEVTYKIGQVFRHRRTGYIAVIYGWDPSCEMSSQWIGFNNVDSLPKGRNQPFYNAFVADDHSTRYVAQVNVMLLGSVDSGGTGETVKESDIKMFGIKVGKWFRRFDYDKGCFVSNLRDEYPED